MSRSFVTSLLTVAPATALVLVACGGSTVVVGKTDATDQKLQTTKDGGATGNGTTCSWANTSLYEQYGKSAPVPTYALGDEFHSIDGCNECQCTAKGIMCTVKSCEPQACDDIAKVCPDGSAVGRTGPNCSFAPCPGEIACTDDAKKCPDGSYVGRVAPSCEFTPCGDTDPGTRQCSAMAMQCPDGSFVGPTGPDCKFVCPTSNACQQIENDAGTKIREVIAAHVDCQIDADCEVVAIAASCVDQCSGVMAKTGEKDYQAVIDDLNASLCKDYASQSCKLVPPPCDPPAGARCVNKKCQ